MITIYDVAKKCECAPATVSKVLNNYSGCSKKMRDRIRKACDELGYIPNINARSIRARRSGIIGVLILIDDLIALNHYLFMSILNSFKMNVEEKGCDILLLSKNLKTSNENFLNHCKTRQIDGVAVLGDFQSDGVKELLDSDIPIVGFDYLGEKISGVTSDNKDKMYELTKHLVNLGHKKIFYIKGEDNFITNERLQGFKKAIGEAKLFDFVTVIQGKFYSQENAYKTTKDILNGSDIPTAIMFPDDFSALGGIKAIQESGLSIPEDISITAYDGLEMAKATNPALTTIRQDFENIGKALANRLIYEIEQRQKEKKILITINGGFVSGASCAKPKN